MKLIKVAVHGALGKVGKEVVKAVTLDSATELVGGVDTKAAGDRLVIPEINVNIPLSDSLRKIIDINKPDVIVDFSVAQAAVPAIFTAIAEKIHLVVGTTGFSKTDVAEIEQLAKENGVGVIIAPNFAIGAVLMMHMAKIAAKYFDYAEIVELHHHLKVDSPSGTSLATARAMGVSHGKPFRSTSGPARGEQVDGIPIHSIRLPGLMAHQEVLLGTAGQTLSIRHDTTSRECYMPGVMLAVKEVINRKGLIFGLDNLLGL